MQNMAYEPAIKLSLPPFNSSSQALSLRELYEENDDMTPGASQCIMAYQGRLRQKGVTFFRLQVHERGRDFTN